jgi:NhaP-type Na+/H+ or K+/H+ antiporter
LTLTWLFVIAGALLITMAISHSLVKRLPITTALLYLVVGIFIGSAGVGGLINIDLVEHAHILEPLSEVAVIISLFTAGLKLAAPLRDPLWRVPVRLAFVSMTITVGSIALLGVAFLDMSWGAAILLGAVLAPTDPVLASDVQVSSPDDRDHVRFGLTGEAGLNDGTAFPFIMLGLGLLGHHELGDFGWKWVAIDVLWAIPIGILTGAVAGVLVGRLVLYLRRVHRMATGFDDFLTLGLIALSYGVALLLHSYGFLAVFAAGLALRRVVSEVEEAEWEDVAANRRKRPEIDLNRVGLDEEEVQVHPVTAPTHLMRAMLGFNEQLEHIGEAVLVVVVGAMLTAGIFTGSVIWFVPALFLVVRPIAVKVGLLGMPIAESQRRVMTWFGIRGIGSIYYLTYAIEHGVEGELADTLGELTLVTIVCSAIFHGVTVTPIMNWYNRRSGTASAHA